VAQVEELISEMASYEEKRGTEQGEPSSSGNQTGQFLAFFQSKILLQKRWRINHNHDSHFAAGQMPA
jgi:hypothetical protein